MNKQIFFLSGLARSGSTLLGSILSQDPRIHVTPTSPILDLLFLVNTNLNNLNKQYTFDFKTVSSNIYDGLIDSFYKNIDRPIVFDKHRAWSKNVMPASMFINPNPKVICTIRPIPEIVVSFLKLMKKSSVNFIDEALKSKKIQITTDSRVKELFENYIMDTLNSTILGIQNHRKNLLLLSYDQIVNRTSVALDKIYDFIEVDKFDGFNFEKIENKCKEDKDQAWGMEGLHDIRSKLGKTSDNPRDVLPKHTIEYLSKYNINLED